MCEFRVWKLVRWHKLVGTEHHHHHHHHHHQFLNILRVLGTTAGNASHTTTVRNVFIPHFQVRKLKLGEYK